MCDFEFIIYNNFKNNYFTLIDLTEEGKNYLIKIVCL